MPVCRPTVQSYSHVKLKSLQYGAVTAHRGKSARYAYIDLCVPVEIQYILQVRQARNGQPPLVANIALIRRFIRGAALPVFPRDLWYVMNSFNSARALKYICRASDLGAESWYAEQLDDIAVVALQQLSGHLILAPITVRDCDVWITVPYDHVSMIHLFVHVSKLIYLILYRKRPRSISSPTSTSHTFNSRPVISVSTLYLAKKLLL